MEKSNPLNKKWSQDFIEKHNHEAQEVWEAFNKGNPIRPPVVLGTNTQFFIFNDLLNPDEKIDFETYTNNAKTMLDFSLKASSLAH